MSTRQRIIDEAWEMVPQASRRDSPGRFTRARFERIVQLLVAVGATGLGALSAYVAFEQGDVTTHPVEAVIIFGALILLVLACATGRLVRPVAGAFALVFPVVTLWGEFVDLGRVDLGQQSWPFYLLTIAVAAAVLAFPIPLQLLIAVGLPLAFGVLRVVRAHGVFEAWVSFGYDISIAVLLNLLVLVLAWMFRGLADGVDRARIEVVDTYTLARVADASESARVEIAALMHDSVLAALIASARAESPRERSLAVEMSRDALTRLANTESDEPEGSDVARSAEWIADAIAGSMPESGLGIDVAREIEETRTVPGRVARALVLAARQAIANAVQHAEGAGLVVAVMADEDGVRVRVSDAGPGVDVDGIPADRLGIRGSILARMAAVGGEADIRGDARGTSVELSWSEPDGCDTHDETGESQ